MMQGCIYLAGHSLGLQPRRTADYIKSHLLTWATKGLEGHFTSMLDSPIPRYVDAGDVVARRMAKLVGASTEPMNEVAVMQTLTANLHLLMASFYRPDLHGRYKIVVEEKAFPSDYVSVPTCPMCNETAMCFPLVPHPNKELTEGSNLVVRYRVSDLSSQSGPCRSDDHYQTRLSRRDNLYRSYTLGHSPTRLHHRRCTFTRSAILHRTVP